MPEEKLVLVYKSIVDGDELTGYRLDQSGYHGVATIHHMHEPIDRNEYQVFYDRFKDKKWYDKTHWGYFHTEAEAEACILSHIE